MRTRIYSIALFGMILASPVIAGENCTCRHNAEDIPEGQSICMKTPKGMQMATCERVLNNTSWKFTGQPCPTALKMSVKIADTAFLYEPPTKDAVARNFTLPN